VFQNSLFMSRFLWVISLFFVLVSCEDRVKFNDPTFQGLKDNVIWKATLIVAVQYPDGSLVMDAYKKSEILTLKTKSTKPQVYSLGVDLLNSATFVQEIYAEKTAFSTGTNSGDGQIEITEYDAVNSTITGTFKFNAKNESKDAITSPNINFEQGTFYQIPLTIIAK
jgi:hypothetical protein